MMFGSTAFDGAVINLSIDLTIEHLSALSELTP
jgi:hypothetical protein